MRYKLLILILLVGLVSCKSQGHCDAYGNKAVKR